MRFGMSKHGDVMKITECWPRIVKGIICFIALLLIADYFLLGRTRYVGDIKGMSKTKNQFSDYKYAMTQYHERYGRLPLNCTNVNDLASVLDGNNTNKDNPDKIRFFPKEKPLKERVLDGFGYPFQLSMGPDGTNFILRSYGNSKRNAIRRDRSFAVMWCDVSILYTQTFAEGDAHVGSGFQHAPNSCTNLPTKETSNVDSDNP